MNNNGFSCSVQRDEIVNGVVRKCKRRDGKEQLDTIIIVIIESSKSFAQYVFAVVVAVVRLKCIINNIDSRQSNRKHCNLIKKKTERNKIIILNIVSNRMLSIL